MEMRSEQEPDILTSISKEKFRRRLAVASRIIAILLIFAIVFIGFIQIKYAKDVYSIKEKYGNLGYCYLCGKESLRSCGCQYAYQIEEANMNFTEFAEQTALLNVRPCEDKNRALETFNVSLLLK